MSGAEAKTATDLAGKNILLTGASRGLGAEIARAFFLSGSNILMVARREDDLRRLQAEMLTEAEKGGSIHCFPADLGDPATPGRIVSRAGELWKKIDVLINNAAVTGPIGKFWENSWEDWETTIRINLLAPVLLCKAVVPWMLEARKGKIINLSGGGATGPRPNFSAYATAKSGLVRFSEVLAHEVREFNIQVNCISPGAMNTDMLEAVRRAGPEKAGFEEYSAAMKITGSEGAVPKKTIGLCCFLASSASDGITGRLISAVWDSWESLSRDGRELEGSDVYTLRRIVPEDRAKKWHR